MCIRDRYWLGAMETATLIVIQLILHRFPVAGDNMVTQSVSVRMENDPETRAAFEALLREHKAVIEKSIFKIEGSTVSMALVLRLAEPISYTEAAALLSSQRKIFELSV